MPKTSTKLHLKILDEERKKIFYKLNNYKKYGFLAGGSALALQINHRISYDFDIFCYKPISHALIKKINHDFKIKNIEINNEDEFSFATDKNIKITFLYYPFTFPEKLIESKRAIDILKITNIGAAKAYAMNRRAAYRDYIDLYYIIKKEKKSLQKIIQRAEKIYKTMFSTKLFLGRLVYHEDLDESEITNLRFIGKQITKKEILEFFKKEVKKYQKTASEKQK